MTSFLTFSDIIIFLPGGVVSHCIVVYIYTHTAAIDEGEEREMQVPTAISAWKRRKERTGSGRRRTSDQSCTFPSSVSQ